MKRAMSCLGAVVLALASCTFDTPPFEEKGYLPCHADKSCDHPDCACLDGKVCVPKSGLAGTLDPQRCQCPAGAKMCAGECTDITRDARHCGNCETDCVTQFEGTIGEPVCQDSQCAVSCPPSAAECDGYWKNGCEPLGTFDHCADCAACNPGQVCNGNVCDTGCDNGEVPCGGACCSQQIQVGQPHGTAVCYDNTRCVMACDPGYGDCTGGVADGCETFLDDVRACRPDCDSTQVDCFTTVKHAEAVTCNAGACGYTQCKIDFGDCNSDTSDGCETPLNTATSCGTGCGNIENCTTRVQNAEGAYCNASRQCDYAKCKLFADECDNDRSDGCENLLDSREHCGACGRECIANNTDKTKLVCQNGICVIPDGACIYPFADCDGLFANGCEANLKYDVLNCDGCGQPCPRLEGTVPICSNGECRFACLPGYANCNTSSPDCETRLGTSTHCLDCGMFCDANNACTENGCQPYCQTSLCSDGSCPDTANNVFNCGRCDNSCYINQEQNSVPICMAGLCDYSCLHPFITCHDPTGNSSGPCNVDPLNSLENCGRCGNACAPGQVCTNGVCGDPGVQCPIADNCFEGSVCCTAAGGAATCVADIRQCLPGNPILTCDGPEDCMSDERCWLETRTGFSGTFCSVQKPSGNAVPLCGSNANCLSDPNEPQACCPHPSVPEINTCQSGCGKCGNTCIVGLCDTNYGLCGDSGTGVCPPPCNAPGGGSICCWNSDTPTAQPTCSMLENCGVQAGTIRLDCNDSLDCVYNPGPGSVCCLAADPGLPQQKLAACVSGPGECQRRFGLVVCASDADCSDTGGGSQQACRPYANSTIIHVCQ